MKRIRKNFLWNFSIACTLFLMLLTGCSYKNNISKETQVYVFIAASLSNAMEEIANKYQDEHPKVKIIYNADSSETLKNQIKEGAECDIFFSASIKQMNELTESGYVEENTTLYLLENKLVLIKPKNMDTKVTGFDNITLAKNLALAGEDVPVGSYAREIFDHMGMLDEVLSMEINECPNVSVVLASVSERSNEVGITYATDAYSKLDTVEILAEAPMEYLNTPVIYPAGQVKNEKANKKQIKEAKDFLEYLQSNEATEIFEKYLFTIHQNNS